MGVGEPGGGVEPGVGLDLCGECGAGACVGDGRVAREGLVEEVGVLGLQAVAAEEVFGVDAADGDAEVLKVSAKSRPSAVAGAIAGVVRENGRAEVQAIGAGATNQAIKAVAISREYLLETGIDAVCVPALIDGTIDNEERTAIRLVIERR